MDKKMNNQSPTILVVDDITANVRVLATMLQQCNYNIAVATDGETALNLLDDVKPDLILLDIAMPKMDGFEVCKRIKARPETKDIPVIFLTARSLTQDIVHGFEVGAVDYVTKPFHRAELLSRVNTQVQLRQAQKEIICLNQKNAVMAMAVTANHEINQPLTILQGNFELYCKIRTKDNMEEKKQKLLDKIHTSIDRIRSVLVKFSQSEGIKIEQYLDNVDMVVFDSKCGEPDSEEG